MSFFGFFVHRYFYIANKNKYSFLKFYFKNTLNINMLLYIIQIDFKEENCIKYLLFNLS